MAQIAPSRAYMPNMEHEPSIRITRIACNLIFTRNSGAEYILCKCPRWVGVGGRNGKKKKEYYTREIDKTNKANK